MNRCGGFVHSTQNVFFGLGADADVFGGWRDCVSLCLMRHSALAFFALINVTTGWGSSLRKTILFRIVQILHRSATILSNGTGEVDVRNLDNQDCILSDETTGSVIETQLCACASCHTARTTGHQRNKCSISSMLALQRGQMGSICSPRFNRVSRVGRNA